MITFRTINELTLEVECSMGNEHFFTKAGAFITGQTSGGNFGVKFEKRLFGPQGNLMSAVIGNIGRRLTGENLPLMEVNSQMPSKTYYANQGEHVTVINLNHGEQVFVESESLLAFTEDCKYSVTLLAQGVISQKGLFTSVLTGNGPNAQVAVLSNGNPIIMSSNNGILRVDPDTVVCWTGYNPGFKLDVGFKNLIGQASGESYQFEWAQPGATVIVQPFERKSGLDIGVDGNNTGARPTNQRNQTIGGAINNTGNAANGLGGAMNNLGRFFN